MLYTHYAMYSGIRCSDYLRIYYHRSTDFMVGWFTEICDMFIKFVGTGWFHWLIAAIILVAVSIKKTHFRP